MSSKHVTYSVKIPKEVDFQCPTESARMMLSAMSGALVAMNGVRGKVGPDFDVAQTVLDATIRTHAPRIHDAIKRTGQTSIRVDGDDTSAINTMSAFLRVIQASYAALNAEKTWILVAAATAFDNGTVWSAEELKSLKALAAEYNKRNLVAAQDMLADLVKKYGNEQADYKSGSPEVARHLLDEAALPLGDDHRDVEDEVALLSPR